MITLTQEKMLKLLSGAIHNNNDTLINEEEWDEIYKELKQQTVQALLLDCTENIQISKEKKMKYVVKSMQSVSFFFKILTEQEKIFALFDAANIPVVVLKGVAAARNYQVPERRLMGDIDIIVLPEDFENAYKVLKENHYTTEETPENFVRHIGFHASSGIHVELHLNFSSSPNKKQNEILDEYVYKGIKAREEIELHGHKAYILPLIANGLVLLGHVNQHLGTGLGLRQIIDWQCYVEKYLTDELWNAEFAVAAEKIGMKKLAEAMTLMCKLYLGLSANITWCDLVDKELADELMEYVLAHGNFGRKDSINAKTVSAIRILKNPFKAIVTLQKMGKRNWKVLDKCPILLPFAWLYQLCRWISHGIRDGVGVKKGIASTKKESRETKLLKRLGVTRL